MFASGPLTRHCPGACGSTFTWSRAASGVCSVRQICAHERKKRWAGVKPSIGASRLFSIDFWNASYATVSPPRSAMFSPRVSLPFTRVAESTTV